MNLLLYYVCLNLRIISIKYQIDRNVGSRGANLGQLMQPHGIAALSPSVSGENGYQLIIADTGNNRVQVIDAISGQFSRLIGGTIKGGNQKYITKNDSDKYETF